MPQTVKVHVTYDETKRIITHQKGGDVQGLRHLFLQVFSDVLSDRIAPANVTFQRYDDKFADYVELNNDEKLKDDLKIRALTWKPDKQVENSTPSAADSEVKHMYCWPIFFPWIHCEGATISPVLPIGPGQPIYMRPHPVKQFTNYRLWNPVSKQNDGLIRRDPNDIVTCDGSFSGSDTVMETGSISRNLVNLYFKDTAPNKMYALTATTGEGGDIIADPGNPGDKSLWEPLYFWSYTMFRNKWYSTLYLGCDNTGKTTLVTNSSFEYPNPQALFVLNKD